MKKIILCDHCEAINRVDREKITNNIPVCGRCAKDLNTTASVKSITFDKLEKIIRHSELPVIVDAYADWCGPCKMYGPTFEQACLQMWNEAEFYKIDTEKNPMISVKYGIRGIPTTLVFNHAQLLKSQSGVLQQADIQTLVNQAVGN